MAHKHAYTRTHMNALQFVNQVAQLSQLSVCFGVSRMELSEAASDISSASSPAGVPACLTSPVENSDCTSAVSSRSHSRHGRGRPTANSNAGASSSVVDDASVEDEARGGRIVGMQRPLPDHSVGFTPSLIDTIPSS